MMQMRDYRPIMFDCALESIKNKSETINTHTYVYIWYLSISDDRPQEDKNMNNYFHYDISHIELYVRYSANRADKDPHFLYTGARGRFSISKLNKSKKHYFIFIKLPQISLKLLLASSNG